MTAPKTHELHWHVLDDDYGIVEYRRCVICDRFLATDESRTIGVGPECLKTHSDDIEERLFITLEADCDALERRKARPHLVWRDGFIVDAKTGEVVRQSRRARRSPRK